MKTKQAHRVGKISRGSYNYRGYNIVSRGRSCWVIFNEDSSLAAETKTLRDMLRTVDKWEL